MESICRLGTEDRLRVCGSVFVALNAEKMPDTNYLRVRRDHQCHRVMLKGMTKFYDTKAKVLQCTLAGRRSKKLLHKFTLLADPKERDTVFVFLAKENIMEKQLPVLRFHTRVTKVAALLSPLNPVKRLRHKMSERKRKRKRENKRVNTDTSEEEFKEDDEYGTNSDFNTASDDEESNEGRDYEDEKVERYGRKKKLNNVTKSQSKFMACTSTFEEEFAPFRVGEYVAGSTINQGTDEKEFDEELDFQTEADSERTAEEYNSETENERFEEESDFVTTEEDEMTDEENIEYKKDMERRRTGKKRKKSIRK